MLQVHPDPHAETLSAWLERRDMPVLYGACRASTKRQQDAAALHCGGGSGSSGDEGAGAKGPRKSVGSKRSSKKKGRDSSDEEPDAGRGSRGRKRTAPGMGRSSPAQSNGTPPRDRLGSDGKREGGRPRGAWRPGIEDEETVSPDHGASSGADTLTALSQMGSQFLAAAAAAARGVPYAAAAGPAALPPQLLPQQPQLQPLVTQLRTGPPPGVLATGLPPGLALAMPQLQPQALRLGLSDGASPLSTATGFACGGPLGPEGAAPLSALPAAVVRPLVQHLSIEGHLIAPRDHSSVGTSAPGGGSRPYVLSLGEPQHTPTSVSAPGPAARAVLLPPASSGAGRTLHLHEPHPHPGRGTYTRPVPLSARVKPAYAAADPTGPMVEGTAMRLDAGPGPGLGPGPGSWSGPVPPGYQLVCVSGPQHAAQRPPGSLLVSKMPPEERPFGHGTLDRPQAFRYMAMPPRGRDGREDGPMAYMRTAHAVPVPHQHPHADERVAYRSACAAAVGAGGGASRMPPRHWSGSGPEDADGDGGHWDGSAPPPMPARVIVRTLQQPDGSESERYGRMTQPYEQVQRPYNDEDVQQYDGPHGQVYGEARVQPRYVVVDRPPWPARAVRGHTQQPPHDGPGPRLGRLVGPPLPNRHPEQEAVGPAGGDAATVVQVQGMEGLRLVRMPGGGCSLVAPGQGEGHADGGHEHGEAPQLAPQGQVVQLPGGGFAVAMQPQGDPAPEKVEQQRGTGMAAGGHEMEHGDEAHGVEGYRDRQPMAREGGGAAGGRAVGRGPPGARPIAGPGAELHRLLLQRVHGRAAGNAQGYEGRGAAEREDRKLPQGVARSAGSGTRPAPAGARFGQASGETGRNPVVEDGSNSSGRRPAAVDDDHGRDGGKAGGGRYADEGPAGSDSGMQPAPAVVYRGRGYVKEGPTGAQFRLAPGKAGRERYAEEEGDAAPGEVAGVYVGQTAEQGCAGAVGHRVVVPHEGVRLVQLPGGQLALEVPEGYIRDGGVGMGVGGEGLRLCGPEQVRVLAGPPPQAYGGHEEDGYVWEHPGLAQLLQRWQPRALGGGHVAQRHVAGGRAVAGPPVYAAPGASGAAPRYVYYDA